MWDTTALGRRRRWDGGVGSKKLGGGVVRFGAKLYASLRFGRLRHSELTRRCRQERRLSYSQARLNPRCGPRRGHRPRTRKYELLLVVAPPPHVGSSPGPREHELADPSMWTHRLKHRPSLRLPAPPAPRRSPVPHYDTGTTTGLSAGRRSPLRPSPPPPRLSRPPQHFLLLSSSTSVHEIEGVLAANSERESGSASTHIRVSESTSPSAAEQRRDVGV